LRAVTGFSAVSAAHDYQAQLWPDIGQHRVVALLAYQATNLVQRARSAGEEAQVGGAVLELGGVAWLAADWTSPAFVDT
jgi:hypothetical protein